MTITKEAITPKQLEQFDLDNFPEDIRMDEEEWTKTLSNGYSAIYVARDEDGEIVGTLILKTSTAPTNMWYFYSVAVVERCRRQGLAATMFHQAIKAEAPLGRINSHCHVDNEPSIALHKALGFSPLEYVPDFYGECEDAIAWVKL